MVKKVFCKKKEKIKRLYTGWYKIGILTFVGLSVCCLNGCSSCFDVAADTGGINVVVSDLHYGFEPNDLSDENLINAIGEIKRSSDINQPFNVFITGDFIHRQKTSIAVKKSLSDFMTDWNLKTSDANGLTVFAVMGNHDDDNDSICDGCISEFLTDTYSGLSYSFDHGGIHMICLDVPSEETIRWLQNDLRNLKSRKQAVIIYQHYPPDSKGFPTQFTEPYFAALKKYNVVAIFCGHHHRSVYYSFKNESTGKQYNIFQTDSPSRHSSPNYLYVFEIKNSYIDIREYNWNRKCYEDILCRISLDSGMMRILHKESMS